jgi:Tfp pilus assembly protein PilZ
MRKGLAMKDLRAHTRIRTNMKVAYRDNERVYTIGRVADLSRGGMYVNTGRPPDIDGFMIASIDAEEFGKVIWVQGRVVWKNYTGMGVEFTRTDEKGLRNLLSYHGAAA